MLFFGKKKSSSGTLDLSWLNADMHSHLVPGIDDGAQDLETSLQLIRGLAGYGYKKLITTPHVLWEMYPNTSEKILNGIEEVKKAAAEEGINVELAAAAEYYADDHLESELKNKVPLLPISKNMVLIEFSMVLAQMDIQQILFEVQLQGYQPIIAHPERYIYLQQRKSFYDELKDSGCLFQMNLLSLTGYYGKGVQELAEYLIKKEYYNLCGTDLHNERHLHFLQKLSSSSQLEKLKDSGKIQNHLL